MKTFMEIFVELTKERGFSAIGVALDTYTTEQYNQLVNDAAEAYAAQWKEKAEKWDALDNQIAPYYTLKEDSESEDSDDDEEFDENEEEQYEKEGDLGVIGELAASAFGYL